MPMKVMQLTWKTFQNVSASALPRKTGNTMASVEMMIDAKPRGSRGPEFCTAILAADKERQPE
jgi:hypothetical protein